MKIRTVTLGVNWEGDKKDALRNDIRGFFAKSNAMFSEAGYEARTQRVTLPPFSIACEADAEATRKIIEEVSVFCIDIGARWFCVPFEAARCDMEAVNTIAVEVARGHKNAFINYIVTEDGRLDRKAFLCTGRFVREVSRLSDNGFDNFRCGVSFNCKANGPFFPFTYHCGGNGFSVSLELVPFCVDVIRSHEGKALEEIRSGIIDGLLPVLKRVNEVGMKIEEATGMLYYGIDASLAPHPEHADNSVVYLVELLGLGCFGDKGTTFFTSVLTNIIESLIKQSGIRTTGFNGVMYSPLEDPGFGRGEKEMHLSLEALLAFSTMCGCGIDMVPLPGDISEEKMASIMLDIGAVAVRLNKPLGVRLLPIPSRGAGELTNFDHDFLHNMAILDTDRSACDVGLFDAKGPFSYL
ncbi:MAG: DUF711 family protein [Planctomycetota bacterium]|jgi:uncharacterized protein (UPF0210 family)